ncbi:MAG: oligosaccharide flippase family protein [Desulfurococcales archaeon]|nr:oligosaccharide flippase family protein [Desulfurococcales archaeon]
MSEEKEGVGRVVKAGIWIYGQTIVNNVFGLLYWLAISRVAGSRILGLTSATIGLATLITSFINLGIPLGIQRFLGREWGRNDARGLNSYYWSGFIFVTLVTLAVAAALYGLGAAGFATANYTPVMFKMTALLVALSVNFMTSSYLASVLRTDIQFLAVLVGNVLKLVVGVGLVLLGYGFIGAVIGYSTALIVILAIGLSYIIKSIGLPRSIKYSLVKEIVKAGTASWIPNLIMMAGQWLGVIAVFGSAGAVSTGYYYIAFTLGNLILMIGFSVIGLLLPYLSSLRDGRKRTAWRAFRLSLIATSPLLFVLLLYPGVPLSLLGREYVAASDSLRLILLAGPAMMLYAVVNNLVYAYGMYGRVLKLGLSQNIPRLILYLLLVPLYGELGAAASFTLGAFVSLPVVHYIARRVGFMINYRDVVLNLALPGALALVAYVLHLGWVAGSLVVLLSYIAYARLGLISREEVKMLAYTFIPREKLDPVYRRFKELIDLLLPPS